MFPTQVFVFVKVRQMVRHSYQILTDGVCGRTDEAVLRGCFRLLEYVRLGVVPQSAWPPSRGWTETKRLAVMETDRQYAEVIATLESVCDEVYPGKSRTEAIYLLESALKAAIGRRPVSEDVRRFFRLAHEKIPNTPVSI